MKINRLTNVLFSIALFLLIDQLIENFIVFGGLNYFFKLGAFSESTANYLFKAFEVVVVLLINHFITKQPFYFARQFNYKDYLFLGIIAAMILLRLRSVPVNTLVDSFLTGLAGGVPEELLARGVIMGALLHYTVKDKYSYGRVLAAIIPSTIIFGLLHLNNIGQYPMSYIWTQVVVAALSGMVYSAIYVRTGSLWYAMLLHFLSDFTIQAGGDTSGATTTVSAAASREFIFIYLVYAIIGLLLFLPPVQKRVPKLVQKIQAK